MIKKINRCQICLSKDIQMTSASPGDGRAKAKCRSCGNAWTKGKRKNEGYAKRRK